MLLLPPTIEDRLLLADPCTIPEDSKAIDFVNECTILWVRDQLDTDTYLDIVHTYFSVEQHIEYLEELFHHLQQE